MSRLPPSSPSSGGNSGGRRGPPTPVEDDGPRINRQITASQVRVVTEDGEQLGVMSREDALMQAEDDGLDLVEVAPDAKPPVCRLLDYRKFKYQQDKKSQEAKKKQKVIVLKEVNLTPNTDVHDIETKQNHIRRWVHESRARVKVGVKYRGREMSHLEVGQKTLDVLLAGLTDIVVKESEPRMEGRRLVVTLIPIAKQDKKEDA